MILPCLYVALTKNKGRGVFTHEDIAAGTVIECSPVIVMSHEDHLLLKKTILKNYVFEWDPPGKPKMCCKALGWIGLYNHSYESNCEHTMNYVDDTISIKTIRNIKAGEELTINYNGPWNSKFLVWFDME